MAINNINNRKKIQAARWQYLGLYLLSLVLVGLAFYQFIKVAPGQVADFDRQRLDSLNAYEARFSAINAEMDSVLYLVKGIETARSFNYVESNINDRIRAIETLGADSRFDTETVRDLIHLLLDAKEKALDFDEELADKEDEIEDLEDNIEDLKDDLKAAQLEIRLLSQ